MAREINSHGVKYVGIYIRELPWKLTADVAARAVWKRSKTRTRRNTSGVSSIRSERDFSRDIRSGKRESLSQGAQMAVAFFVRSFYIVNFWQWANAKRNLCVQNLFINFLYVEKEMMLC